MARYIRNTVILAKAQTGAGVYASPAGASDAMLVSDFSITPLDARVIDRKLVRGYFGNSEGLPGPASVKVSLTTELSGSGTAGTVPTWGDLLVACTGVETGALTARSRVEYTLASTGLKPASIEYFDDGLQHKIIDAMGNAKLSCKAGEVPTLAFDFVGLDNGIAAAAPSGVSYSTFKTPIPLAKANVATDITLGCTWTAASGFSGGTAYPSNGLTIDFGCQVQYTPLLSSESVDITDRNMTGHIDLDLTPAQELALINTVKAGTTTGLGFKLGTAAGAALEIWCPAVQLLNPTKVDVNGKRLIGFDLRLCPTAGGSGNDEFKLVML